MKNSSLYILLFVMALPITNSAVAEATSNEGVSTCALHLDGLLSAVEQSDAIVEVREDKSKPVKGNSSSSPQYEVRRVLGGSLLKAGEHISVVSAPDPTFGASLFYNNNFLTGFSSYPLVNSEPEHRSFFLIKKVDNQLCLILHVGLYDSMAEVSIENLLKGYIAIARHSKREQALGLLRMLLPLSKKEFSMPSDFPLGVLLFDWSSVKSEVDKKVAEDIVAKTSENFRNAPHGALVLPLAYLMPVSLKRELVLSALAEYDNKIAEMKRVCSPGNKPAEHKELTLELLNYMDTCTQPPTSEVAALMGIENPATYNESDIERAREFVKHSQ